MIRIAPWTAADAAYPIIDGTLIATGAGLRADASDPSGQPMTVTLEHSAEHGTLMLGPTGSFSYYAEGYVGTDSFGYEVTAGGVASNVATVTLTVVGTTPPTPPVANPDA